MTLALLVLSIVHSLSVEKSSMPIHILLKVAFNCILLYCVYCIIMVVNILRV